jgi:PhoH-like ATPase
MPKLAVPPAKSKLFILDTNVLMHDPASLFSFAEHDILLPMITLEELDAHKKGMADVSRNVRQVSRMLDKLVQTGDINTGFPLKSASNGHAKGSLFIQSEVITDPLPKALPDGKADNQILGVVQYMRQKYPDRKVILVSKDINIRIKARALGFDAEDYSSDKMLEDTDILPTGMTRLPANFWQKNAKNLVSGHNQGKTYYKISGTGGKGLVCNQFVEIPGAPLSVLRVVSADKQSVELETLTDFTNQKNAVWGIMARNQEQNCALNLLLDPTVDFVTLLGQAGTGKTLLTLAAALHQTLETKIYDEVIFTRATVAMGEDIGFLPGTEEEKLMPWMGAVEDTLDVLSAPMGGKSGSWQLAATREVMRSRIKIKAMTFMRGRTFIKKLLILDEAQNLTAKQMKSLITRAGQGTKIVCLGNLAQIDTPYLTEGSSGLTYAVDRFRGWAHNGHITLLQGERSRLADYANSAL